MQVATTLPLFLLTLPAGALTDVVDPRRLLIVTQTVAVVISVVFAAVVSAGLASPLALLGTSFLMGASGALAAPAWLLINTILVRRTELDSAIAIDTAGYNIARAIGPAIAGYAIAGLSIAVPFWCCRRRQSRGCLRRWSGGGSRQGRRKLCRPKTPDQRDDGRGPLCSIQPRDGRDAHPRHRLLSIRQRLSRLAAAGGPQADGRRGGGLWPTDGGDRRGLNPGPIGLKWLKRRLGANGQAALGAIGTIIALCLLAAAHEPMLALVASFIYGAPSIVALTTFFVSAQVALPEWVRGRGLAIFLTVYFGALTLGSAVWGEVATVKGVPFALTCAAAGTLIGMALTWAWKLQTNEAQDLTPSMRWRAPCFLNRVTDDRGPILAIAEYRIDPKDSAAFLAVMQDISLERRRDGAYAWHMFEDPDDEGKIIETYPRPFGARTQISRIARHQS